MYVGHEVNPDKAKYTVMSTGQDLEGNNNIKFNKLFSLKFICSEV